MFLLSSSLSGSNVAYATSHVFSTRTTHVLHHTVIQKKEGGERCAFLAGNTVVILSLCQLKMRILRLVVHSEPVTKYHQASKTQRQI